MFTGLIEAVGHIEELHTVAGAVRLRIGTTLAAEMRPGDSLAVDGVCLTATAVEGGHVLADVGPETLRVTTLGSMRAGQLVNLERAMRADARFGGHFVQGHVDGTGAGEGRPGRGRGSLGDCLVRRGARGILHPKGSIAADGVSLTIAALRDREFDVMIVPFTWRHTNMHVRRPGDRVNLECDIVGKYVARAAQVALAAS